MKKIISIAFIIAICFTISCKEDEPQAKSYNVNGLVQKGPFVVGTTLSIAELTPSMNQTGNSFTSEVTDNTGIFDVSEINLTSSFVELSATGFYFDEVKAEISTAPLTLKALSDLTNVSTVNVNVLTHLEKARVEYLVGEGSTFSEAKETAQGEVLAAFGMNADNLDNSELLDMAFDNPGGAVLLAVSVILQGNRSVGDLSEMLSTITNDLREDGTIDNTALLSSLRESTKQLNLSRIRTNLATRYSELQSGASIPAFEIYIDAFLSFTGTPPTSSTSHATNVEAFSVTLQGEVIANSLQTTVWFEYGTTTSYGSEVAATPGSVNGNSTNSLSAQVTGLLAAQTYHFRLKSENAKGVTYGEDRQFTTLGGISTATTTSATSVQPTQVTLNAIVNANYLPTTITFEYGPTTSYGNAVQIDQGILEGNSDVNVTATIQNLVTAQVYHFRVKAENSSGVSFGNDFSFIPYTSIGSPFQGGLLAYILLPDDPGYDPNTIHGFVVGAEDLGILLWHNYENFPTRHAGSKLIGGGIGNTLAHTHATYQATSACYNLVLNGYDDWFLPSTGELELLKPNHTTLGLKDGVTDFYWSSTDVNGCCNFSWYSYAYSFSGTGTLIPKDKDQGHLVRPMRAF